MKTSPASHRIRRLIGIFFVAGILLLGLGLLGTISAGTHPARYPKFTVVPRPPYVPALDPIKMLEGGFAPNSSNAKPVAFADSRAIEVYSNRVVLLRGGQQDIVIPGAVTTLSNLVSVINNPNWLEYDPSTGQAQLKVALIIKQGNFRISEPVKSVALLDQPSNFIGVQNAALSFSNVSVGVYGKKVAAYYAPFVFATSSTMNITNSHFTGLGWDWNGSYGTTYSDSTGNITGSSFNGGFIGLYTTMSHNMTIKDSSFNDNRLYGLDPHTYSSHLTISHVTAMRNKAHGIIFSEHVTNSVISDSTSSDNGENGIMMDARSLGNTIQRNTVTGNTGDGLVSASSPGNEWLNNTVDGNRIGVRFDPNDSRNARVANNTVTNNGLASQDITLDNTNTVVDNGGQWNFHVLLPLWGGVLGTIPLLGIVLLIVGRRRPRQTTPPRTRN